MLHITLREGEYIKIGDNITIHCTRAGARDALSFGIEAPKDVGVHRQEVYDAIHGSRAGKSAKQPSSRKEATQ